MSRQYPTPEKEDVYLPERLYTLAQVAQMFGVSWGRIQQLASGGRIQGAVRPGREWVIFHGAEILHPEHSGHHPEATGAIERYLEECREENVPATIPPPWWEEEIYADKD